MLSIVNAEEFHPSGRPRRNRKGHGINCVEREGVYCNVQITDDPIRGIEGSTKVVKDPEEVTLEGTTKLEEVTLSDVPVRAPCRLAVGYTLKGETVQLFLRFEQI